MTDTKRSRGRQVLLLTGAVAACGILGLGAGAAAAVVPTLLSPAGVSAGAHVRTAPMEKPDYPSNASGETFGSAATANSPENEPDLIRAVATNGAEGYVRKTDLDEASGATAAKSFRSPDEALAWQQAEGRKDKTIKVYAADGKRVIGEFQIAGSEAQERTAQPLPISLD